jgi:hypothetical protein
LNVTGPVGVPLDAVTVAVTVTDCPNGLGLADEMTDVVVVLSGPGAQLEIMKYDPLPGAAPALAVIAEASDDKTRRVPSPLAGKVLTAVWPVDDDNRMNKVPGVPVEV